MRSFTTEAARPTRGVRPEWIAGVVLAGFAMVSVLNAMAIFVLHSGMRGKSYARMVYFDQEANFATLFNFLLLAGIVALLALNAARAYAEGSSWRHHWTGLVALFLLLAFDEAAQMHEELNRLIGRSVELEGYLYFVWVIPGLAFAFAVGLVYLRFLLALPRRVAGLALLGGGLFVAGALGVEMVGAKLWSEQAMGTVRYSLVVTAEESLEMLGLIVFGYGLMLLLADADGWLRLPARA